MLALNGARKMALTCAHQCAHSRFTGNKRLDRAVNQAISVLLFTQDAMTYHHDHTEVHHGAKTFVTQADPVLMFIESQGFHPGMSERSLWRRMWTTLVSPRFHWAYFRSRARHNLIVPAPWRRAAGLAYVAAWTAFVLLVHGGWKVGLVSFVVPVVLLYQVSAFLELLCEHDWLRPDEPGMPARMRRATHSWARFCGARVPQAGGASAWLRWTGQMLFFHLPMRLFVLTGDAPQHDYHHRFVSTTEWTVAAYARQRDIDGGHPGQPPYTEFWGLNTALAYVFARLSERRTADIRFDPGTGRLELALANSVVPGLPVPVPAHSV
jgi:Fatty acid desaturase